MTARPPREVLIVDDEFLPRAVLAEWLAEAGYAVLQACDAAEALAVLDARPDALCVLSDVEMPGPMNGIGLAWAIARRWPDVPVTLVSGGSHPPASGLPHGVVFIARPCPLDVIALHVARMVDTIGPAPTRDDGTPGLPVRTAEGA